MHRSRRAISQAKTRPFAVLLRARLGLAMLLALGVGFPGHSQSSNPPVNGQVPVHPYDSSHSDLTDIESPALDPVMAERRLRALNIERQKQMVSDANKLLKLAKELNDEVAGAHADALTPAQLHKIAEIEKLARNVKERMASAVGPPSGFEMPVMPSYPTHVGASGP